MNSILTVFFFLLIIGVLVFVHELGHFLAAKLTGVPVKEFAIGFGSPLFSKVYKGTKYSINLIPMGGYVSLEGEVSGEGGEGSFRNKRFRVKLLVLSAGVLMNILLAIILFSVFLASSSYKFNLPNLTEFNFTSTKFQKLMFPIAIGEVLENSRSKGELNEGDVFVAIDNKYFKNTDEFREILKNYQGKSVNFQLINLQTLEITDRLVSVEQQDSNGAILDVKLGAAIEGLSEAGYFLEYNHTALSGVSMANDMFFYQVKVLGSLFSKAFSTGNYNQVASSVGGLPVLVDQVNQVVSVGAFQFLIFLAGLISLSLAFFNILPFPALDGGQIAVFLIEKIRGKKIADETLQKINTAGFVILIAFALLINLKDIIQLNWLGGILDFFRKVIGR